MIIYKIQESGKATDFTPAKKCPEGWKSIKLDDKIRKIEDIDPMDYHEQKYLDYLESIDYKKNRVAEYPDPMELNDAKVKQHSTDENIQAEGIAQEQQYYVDCLDVKKRIPKPNLE